MKKIVGVRFKRLGKIYFFDPKWLEVQKGEYIIVETTQGEDIAEVIIAKQRGGSTGTVKLYWMGNYTKFVNIERRFDD